MPVVMLRLWRYLSKQGIKTALFLIVLLVALCYIPVYFSEPQTSALRDFGNYLWWFLVSITTVGYGDFYPVSFGGRVTALFIFVGGIGAFGMVAAQSIDKALEIGRKVKMGQINIKVKNHIVLFGYHAGRTEQLIKEILADTNRQQREILLCVDFEKISENPIPDIKYFVRGNLKSDDVMRRSCVADADRVVIDGRNDDQSSTIALAVNEACQDNPGVHIVIGLMNPDENTRTIHRINAKIECVTAHVVSMMVQAMQDPGASRVFSRLLSNTEGQALYRINVPQSAGSWSYIDLLVKLKRLHEASLVAVAPSHDHESDPVENPLASTIVQGGMAIFYIARARIPEIAWDQLSNENNSEER